MQVKKFDKSFLWVGILFCISIIIRFYLLPDLPIIKTYSDELRYLDIARSLFSNHEITIRHAETYFQKILYPILIAPAMIFQSPYQQLRAIGIINIIWLSSCVFPLYLIAKRMEVSRKIIIISTVTALIFPDMTYSMTFMSECVYLPISLWLIYVSYEIINTFGRKKKCSLAFVGGLINYLLYLNKEIALFYLLAFTLLPMVKKIIYKEKADILPIVFYGLGFLSFFIFFKVTIFSGLPNSYNQMGINAILSPYNFLFFIYSNINTLIFTVIGFGFFTIFVTLFLIKYLKKEQQELFIYLLLGLLIAIATISYTISIREDLGLVSIRMHTRYFAVLFLPLFLLFMAVMEKGYEFTDLLKVFFLFSSCLVGVLIFIVVQTIRDGSVMDTTILSWWNVIIKKFNSIFGIPMVNELNFNIGLLIVKALFFAYIMIGTAGIILKKKWIRIYVVGAVLGMFLLNNLICMHRYRSDIDSDDVNECIRINNYLSQNGGNCLYLMEDYANSTYERLIDCYINYPEMYMALEKEIIKYSLSGNDDMDLPSDHLKTITWTSSQEDLIYDELNHIDYVLFRKNSIIKPDENSMVKVDIESRNFSLYRNLTPNVVKWADNYEYKMGDTLYFNSDNKSGNYHMIQGLRAAEPEFTWSIGKRTEFLLKINEDEWKQPLDLSLDFHMNYEPVVPVEVYANNSLICKTFIDSDNRNINTVIPKEIMDSRNLNITIIYPNVKDDDKDTLMLAFKKMYIKPSESDTD